MVKRYAAAYIAGLCALAYSLAGEAQTTQTVTATWTNATKNTDTTNIPATGAGSLAQTIVEYGTKSATGGFGTKQSQMQVAAPATSLQLNLVVAQEYALRAFHCNTFATSFVLDGPGCSSASNVVIATPAPPKPQPPSGLVASGNLTAYVLSQSLDRLALVPIGHVAPGTMCDTRFSASDPQHGTLYAVPKSSVAFVPDASSELVFSTCS